MAVSSAPPVEAPGTLPTIAFVEGSAAHTSGGDGATDTSSDVNAPTIITLDAVPTSPPSSGLPPQTPAKAAPAVGSRGLVDDMASSVTVVQTPKAPALLADGQESKKSRGKPLLFVGAGALVLILAVVGVGGFFAFNWLNTKPDESTATKGKTSTDGTSSGEALATAEFGRYWLEVLPAGLVAEPMRVAGAVPLASGQAFKFHLVLDQGGYLYIVGPGEGNKPTAFLTEKPASISGLDSNQVTKGSDFSFPSGLEHWLELDKKPGTENYTIVFSPAPLTAPAFFTEQATGKPLSETEQAELNDFLGRYKTSEPVTELKDKDGAAPFVIVKVPRARDSGSPVIFGVRIQHK